MIPVIAVSNRVPIEPYYCYAEFLESLERFGNPPTILGMGEEYRGMMSRLKLPLAHMRSLNSKHVILTDSWDVIFLDHPERIVEVFQTFNKPIVFSSERTLFPDKNYGAYPEGKTDSRYLNAGFIVAESEALIELFDHLGVPGQPDDHQNEDGSWTHYSEQELLHHAFVEQYIPMTLDYYSVLCQSMFQTKPKEIVLNGDGLCNTSHDTYPKVIHWNGPAKTTAFLLPQTFIPRWKNQ